MHTLQTAGSSRCTPPKSLHPLHCSKLPGRALSYAAPCRKPGESPTLAAKGPCESPTTAHGRARSPPALSATVYLAPPSVPILRSGPGPGLFRVLLGLSMRLRSPPCPSVSCGCVLIRPWLTIRGSGSGSGCSPVSSQPVISGRRHRSQR